MCDGADRLRQARTGAAGEGQRAPAQGICSISTLHRSSSAPGLRSTHLILASNFMTRARSGLHPTGHRAIARFGTSRWGRAHDTTVRSDPRRGAGHPRQGHTIRRAALQHRNGADGAGHTTRQPVDCPSPMARRPPARHVKILAKPRKIAAHLIGWPSRIWSGSPASAASRASNSIASSGPAHGIAPKDIQCTSAVR